MSKRWILGHVTCLYLDVIRVARRSNARSQPISIQKLVPPSSDWLLSELVKGQILTILTFFFRFLNKIDIFMSNFALHSCVKISKLEIRKKNGHKNWIFSEIFHFFEVLPPINRLAIWLTSVDRDGSLTPTRALSIQKLVLPSSDWLLSELVKGTIMTILTFFLFFDKNDNEVGGFGHRAYCFGL